MLTELDEIWQRSAVAWNTFVDALVSPGKQKRLFFFCKYLKVPKLQLYTSPQTWWQSATAGRARVKNWYPAHSLQDEVLLQTKKNYMTNCTL